MNTVTKIGNAALGREFPEINKEFHARNVFFEKDLNLQRILSRHIDHKCKTVEVMNSEVYAEMDGIGEEVYEEYVALSNGSKVYIWSIRGPLEELVYKNGDILIHAIAQSKSISKGLYPTHIVILEYANFIPHPEVGLVLGESCFIYALTQENQNKIKNIKK